MKPIHTFITIPSLPKSLERLRDLAYNLRWAWDYDTVSIFIQLDPDLWENTGHNPVLMLGSIDQKKLDQAASDEGFLAQLDRVAQGFDDYMSTQSTWFSRNHGSIESPLVAYFSAEFGVTECLSVFAGGLGVLAGDHLKSASDLGVPLVGVGLLYQQGYFRQYLNEAGWQQENYIDNDFYNLPLFLEYDDEGKPATVSIEFPGRNVIAQIWRAQVGRVPLYLLDTNVPDNSPDDRSITYQLYGGDTEHRIKQEIVLGIGGFRALEKLQIQPRVFHMNEGHSAFLALERIRRLMEKDGLSYQEAFEAASAGLVFTTHTPVKAGHDYFDAELMEQYFGDYYPKLSLEQKDFLGLGRKDPDDAEELFCMTVLALRTAAYSNGVSKLHGEVSQQMWQTIWPEVPVDEIPIGHVTNGVHFLSWISWDMKQLFDRYLGPRWRREPADKELWYKAEHIPVGELWRTHERRRERLVAISRQKLREQLERRGATQAEVEGADEVLDANALTIGFSRRFATYKRATLILRDPDRLDRILNNPERPVQLVFAGKAHPKDEPGKELIQQIVSLAREERFRRKIVFLEDYDMAVARYLVQGSDVWLNNPLRPREASGTSGIKAAANGVLNLSILDGWWDEAYQSNVGWAIGGREEYDEQEYQDAVEAESMYELLEQEVVPMFYDQSSEGLSRRWVESMKDCIAKLSHFFNTHRMVEEYTDKFYLSSAVQYKKLTADGMSRAKHLAAWLHRVNENWTSVQIEPLESGPYADLQVGTKFTVKAKVTLGKLKPEDVGVELFLGLVNSSGDIIEGRVIPMQSAGGEEGVFLYEANHIECKRSGKHGYTIRVIPRHEDLTKPFLPNLITWA